MERQGEEGGRWDRKWRLSALQTAADRVVGEGKGGEIVCVCVAMYVCTWVYTYEVEKHDRLLWAMRNSGGDLHFLTR